MIRQRWSLRWLIGGIYFFIMAIILGALALYFSQRTAKEYMKTMAWTLEGQAMLGADMLKDNLTKLKDHLAEKAKLDSEYRAETKGVPGAERLNSHVMRLAKRSRELETTFDPLKDKISSVLRNISIRTRARSVTLIDLNGVLIADSRKFAIQPELTTLQPEMQQVLHGASAGEDVRFNPDTNEEILFTAVPVQAKSFGRIDTPLSGWGSEKNTEDEIPVARRMPRTMAIMVLATATPQDVNEEISRMRWALAMAFIGALLVLIFINAGVSSYISQPLATLSAAAERFARGNLHEQVVPSGGFEISSLGASFNRMAAQLRGTITRLAEERAQAEAILASMVDGVLVTDSAGKVLLINHSAELICGLQEREVLGKMLPEVFLHVALNDLLQKTLASGESLRDEITFVLPVEQIIEVHMAPVQVDGRPLGVVIVLYDITHQRKLEQVRRDFVANVSHELRTPVTSIRAMAETLFDAVDDDPEMTHDFLETIIGESERLTGLLDDLLQLSRIESGRHVLRVERIDICQEIRHVAQRVMAPITAKAQHLVLNLPETAPLDADRNALVQVLVNLLDNARKYSPEGGAITVTVEPQAEVLCISVADTGYGIPQADLDRIFERFYRVDKARSRAQGGTGLGLAIVKHLLELHGGSIRVESEVGVGSCFTVELPHPTLEMAPEEAGELPSGAQVSASQGMHTPG